MDARFLYLTYAHAVDYTAASGMPLHTWEAMGADYRAAWEVVARCLDELARQLTCECAPLQAITGEMVCSAYRTAAPRAFPAWPELTTTARRGWEAVAAAFAFGWRAEPGVDYLLSQTLYVALLPLDPEAAGERVALDRWPSLLPALAEDAQRYLLRQELSPPMRAQVEVAAGHPLLLVIYAAQYSQGALARSPWRWADAIPGGHHSRLWRMPDGSLVSQSLS